MSLFTSVCAMQHIPSFNPLTGTLHTRLSTLFPCTRKDIITAENMRTGSFHRAGVLGERTGMTLGCGHVFLCCERKISELHATAVDSCVLLAR